MEQIKVEDGSGLVLVCVWRGVREGGRGGGVLVCVW